MNRAQFHDTMMEYVGEENPRRRDHLFSQVYPYIVRIASTVCHTYRIPAHDHDDVISRIAMSIARYDGTGHAESYLWVRARQYASHYRRDRLRSTSTMIASMPYDGDVEATRPHPDAVPYINGGRVLWYLPHDRPRDAEDGSVRDIYPASYQPTHREFGQVEKDLLGKYPGILGLHAVSALHDVYDDADLSGYNVEILQEIYDLMQR